MKRFEIIVTATLGKHLVPSMPKQYDDLCIQEDQDP